MKSKASRTEEKKQVDRVKSRLGVQKCRQKKKKEEDNPSMPNRQGEKRKKDKSSMPNYHRQ